MTDTAKLFDPVIMGDLNVPNRVFMAPLTRNRAHGDGTPRDIAATYYGQRASAGLILSEATQISAMAKGYKDTPGIYTDAHIAAWKKITDAVHAAGGRIYCQLWHVGRISHVSVLPEGKQPVSSSDIQAKAQTFTEEGFQDVSKPVALDKAGIEQTIADYVTAAQAAKEAGFDGIEVHSANGYLLDQFLQDGVNTRTDEYGGSIDNRMRLLTEVLDAVSKVWDNTRIGVRLSPLGEMSDISDSDSKALFSAVYTMLDKRQLAYLHVVEKFPGSEQEESDRQLIKDLRELYNGFYIANGGYDADSSADAVKSGHADAVTIGRPFIANPDLPERYRRGANENEPNPDTFYGGDEIGYTDYPFLDERW